MKIDVVEESPVALREYAQVPIAFEVREAFDVVESRADSDVFRLTPRAVAEPYLKNYDEHDGGPEAWSARFDLSHWRFFGARVNGRRVGGAAVVFRAPDVDMLAGRTDVAIVWDLRVALSARRHGVGAALIASVEAWSAAHGARWLEVETQTINVPACRFYERLGFALRGVNRLAYPTLPDEIQLLWYKKLADRHP